MTPTRRPIKPSRLVALPSPGGSNAHVDPTTWHRKAADDYLRGNPVDATIAPLLKQVISQFGWAENGYVSQAREQGDQSRVWDTARWIIANAIAREEATDSRA